MSGAGDPPAPVGDPPTGTAARNVAKRPCPLARTVAPARSGESPDGTGGSPVLPANHFPNTLQVDLLFGDVCCAQYGLGRGARREHPRQWDCEAGLSENFQLVLRLTLGN